MLRWTKWIVPVAGLVLAVGFTQPQTRAADAPAPAVAPAADAKASVTVTVVDADGKPVVGANVSLMAAPAKKKKGDTAVPTTAPAGKPQAVASGVTDADGKAILTNVPDGKYRAAAKMKGAGNGREAVTVTDGKDVTISVTLKPKAAKSN